MTKFRRYRMRAYYRIKRAVGLQPGQRLPRWWMVFVKGLFYPVQSWRYWTGRET